MKLGHCIKLKFVFCFNIVFAVILYFNCMEAASTNIPKGTTPLRNSKRLRQADLKTRNQLNEAEAENIQRMYTEYFQHRNPPLEWFNEDYLKKIHREMFNDIWTWAGVYYTGKLRNIGIHSSEIPQLMHDLCKEIEGYLKASSELSILEQSARILQKLLVIHPFMNGNGRHARFISDLYLYSLHGDSPQWPNKALINDSKERTHYIDALERADLGDFILLEDLILKYGGRNPSFFAIVENSFFKQNFLKSKRKEFIFNNLYFNCRMNTSYIPVEWSPHRFLVEISLHLIDLQASP